MPRSRRHRQKGKKSSAIAHLVKKINRLQVSSKDAKSQSEDSAEVQEDIQLNDPDQGGVKVTVGTQTVEGAIQTEGTAKAQPEPGSTWDELNLNPNLLKGMHKMGLMAPMKMQKKVLPMLLANPPRNMIVESDTGHGTTVALLLAMFGRVDPTKQYTQALCIIPFIGASDTANVAFQMVKYFPEIKVGLVKGTDGISENPGIFTNQIVIGDHSVMYEWTRTCKFDKISLFIIDLADPMMGMFRSMTIPTLKKLPASCQIVLFSTKFTADNMEFAEIAIPNPIVIRRNIAPLEEIKQYYIRCQSMIDKYEILCQMCDTFFGSQAVIFCNNATTAKWLAKKMIGRRLSVDFLIEDSSIDRRRSVMKTFEIGFQRLLITTDRLLPLVNFVYDQVAIVINFDLPINAKRQADCDTYLRRAGGAGKLGTPNKIINLVDSDHSMLLCQTVEKHFNKTILNVDSNDISKMKELYECF